MSAYIKQKTMYVNNKLLSIDQQTYISKYKLVHIVWLYTCIGQKETDKRRGRAGNQNYFL